MCEKQPERQFGVLAVLGRASIEIVRLQRGHYDHKRTGLLDFRWDASNPGFQVSSKSLHERQCAAQS
jgi:hypothetical protein